MQFKFLGEYKGNGSRRHVAEQCEVWTLQAVKRCFKDNLDEAAKMFGAPKQTMLDRMQKYDISID